MFKVIALIIATFLVFAVSRGILAGLPNRVDDPVKFAIGGGENSEKSDSKEIEKIETTKGVLVKDGKLSFSYPNNWIPNETHGSSTIIIIRKGNNIINVRKEMGDFRDVKKQEAFMISDAVLESGKTPDSISKFDKVSYGKNTFYSILLGRGKGLLSYSYYLPSKTAVYTFSFVSRDYDWRDSKLNEDEDETYAIFKTILKSVVLKK